MAPTSPIKGSGEPLTPKKAAFAEPLHVGRPNSGDVDAFLVKVRDIFERRWFTNNGKYVQEFEARLKSYLGVRHCIPICNATVGLEIASRALGLKGEVIVPSFTFVATAHALTWQGITPVFCDVDPHSHNLDVAQIEALITPKTTGILGVHVWGRPCQIEDLTALGRHHGLKILFDAAHAFGNSHKGRMIGNFGDAEVFSFHATKFFNSFEGGAIATNDDALAKKIRLMKNFGFSGVDNVESVGTNGKMTEVSAAMGLTSLDAIDLFISKNRENYQNYLEVFSQIRGLKLAKYDEGEKNNYQYIVAEVDEVTAGFTRDELVKYLHGENVLARRYFYPGCHQMEPYRTESPAAGESLKETVKLSHRVAAFPNGMAVAPGDIEKIGRLILQFQESKRPLLAAGVRAL